MPPKKQNKRNRSIVTASDITTGTEVCSHKKLKDGVELPMPSSIDVLKLPGAGVCFIDSVADIDKLHTPIYATHGLFKPKPTRVNDLLINLFLCAAQGKQAMVKTLLSHPPHLHYLLARGDIIDYAGRTFSDITAFQYTVWAGDSSMWMMMIDCIKEAHAHGYSECEMIREDLLRQLNHIETEGLRYQMNGEEKKTSRFDFQPLCDTLQAHLQSSGAWSVAQQDHHWLTVVVPARRTVPSYVAQEYCRKDRTYCPVLLEDGSGGAGKIRYQTQSFKGVELPRGLEFFNWRTLALEYWWPAAEPATRAPGYRLSTERWSRPVSMHGRLSSAIRGHDLIAVINECKERYEGDIAMLKLQLTTPLQKPKSTSGCIIS